jgi:hypothetical protein
MTILYVQVSLLDWMLACADKIIPGLHNDRTREWQRVREEGKALYEETQKLKDRDD